MSRSPSHASKVREEEKVSQGELALYRKSFPELKNKDDLLITKIIKRDKATFGATSAPAPEEKAGSIYGDMGTLYEAITPAPRKPLIEVEVTQKSAEALKEVLDDEENKGPYLISLNIPEGMYVQGQLDGQEIMTGKDFWRKYQEPYEEVWEAQYPKRAAWEKAGNDPKAFVYDPPLPFVPQAVSISHFVTMQVAPNKKTIHYRDPLADPLTEYPHVKAALEGTGFTIYEENIKDGGKIKVQQQPADNYHDCPVWAILNLESFNQDKPLLKPTDDAAATRIAERARERHANALLSMAEKAKASSQHQSPSSESVR